MTFTIDNQEYTLHFWHMVKRYPHDLGRTECVLHQGRCQKTSFIECREPIRRHALEVAQGRPHQASIGWFGVAYCSKNDQFVKRIGRKIALARALAPMSREQRRPFWLAYLIATQVICKKWDEPGV